MATEQGTEKVEVIYEIPSFNMVWLEDHIAKLNKRAKRLHLQEIILERYGHFTKTIDGNPVVFFNIKVIGQRPKLNGWTFIATLQRTPDGTIVRAVPGLTQEGELAGYRDAGNWCDHCQLNRKRNDTYIVRHDVGVTKQVGSDCLADFLGHKSPQAIASMAEFLGLAGELANVAQHGEGIGGQTELFDLVAYLSWVHVTIRNYGWLSRGKARESLDNTPATANRALYEWEWYIKNRPDKIGNAGYRREHQEWFKPEARDVEEANKALEWVRGLEVGYVASSDYLSNLRTVCNSDVVDVRMMGIAASLFAAYWKAIEREREKANRKPSEWQGEPGDKITRTVLVTKLTYGEGYRGGTSYIYQLQDANGNKYTWFASDEVLEAGKIYELMGTVKKHDEYKEVKKTVLTRCRVIKEVEE